MRAIALCLAAAAVCVVATPILAQGNDNDYTPLNSRIRRQQQFPTDIVNRWHAETSAVSRARNRAMLNQFSKCVYGHSRENSMSLLEKTDFGFVNFSQIEMDAERAMRVYGFADCLSRVANTHGSGVQLRFSASALRMWLVQEAYFDRYQDGPTWIVAGNVIDERTYPLSDQQRSVRAAMDLADCVVAADPYTADFFYRTAGGSDEETRSLQTLAEALGPCLPQGQQFSLNPQQLRPWIGEALWHASTSSHAAPAAAPVEAGQ